MTNSVRLREPRSGCIKSKGKKSLANGIFYAVDIVEYKYTAIN